MRKTKIILIIILFFIGSFSALKFTRSYFSDTEAVLGNSIQVGTWGEGEPTPTPTEEAPLPESTPTPTPTPESSVPTVTPTPTPIPVSPVAGSVVINELMWMGSVGNSDDEWIELRNTTGNTIDLSNWQITKWVAGTHEVLMLTIPSGKTIPANGYFLISHFNKDTSLINIDPDLVDDNVALNNSNLRIKLYKGDWTNSVNLVDTADDGDGNPLAGTDSANRQSMERKDDPLTGWQTCTNDACNDTTYWDAEGTNYGTPKAANL